MKALLIILTFIIASCASQKSREVLGDNADALSNESLSRQDLDKDAKAFSAILLSKCYKNKSFNVKEYSRIKLDKLKNSFSYWSAIGSCYLHKGEAQKGMFFYKLALPHIKNNSQRATYFNNLGVFYTKVNRLDTAIDFFNKAINKNRNYKTPHMNLAMIYAQYSLNIKAQKHLAVFKNKNDPHITYLRAIIDANLGKNDALKRVAKSFPAYLTEEEKELALEKIVKN